MKTGLRSSERLKVFQSQKTKAGYVGEPAHEGSSPSELRNHLKRMLTALSVPARDAATGGSGGKAELRGRCVEESVRAAKSGMSNLATGSETACPKVLGCRTERVRKEGGHALQTV